MPNLVEQQHIVQDPNPFAILVINEDIENYDDGAQQFLPDHIKNQGAEDAISAEQNHFDPNQEDQGAPQQVQGAQKYHKNWWARIKVDYVLEGAKLEDESDSNKKEPESRK